MQARADANSRPSQAGKSLDMQRATDGRQYDHLPDLCYIPHISDREHPLGCEVMGIMQPAGTGRRADAVEAVGCNRKEQDPHSTRTHKTSVCEQCEQVLICDIIVHIRLFLRRQPGPTNR